MKEKKLEPGWLLTGIFFICLFWIGLFHEYTACLLGATLGILLILHIRKEKQLVIYKNAASLAVAVIGLFYALSCLWALDRGMAFVGFLKYVPVFLFCLLLMQWPQVRKTCLALLPWAMAVMTVVSSALSLIPGIGESFLVADRLAGFLQYPNTFALLLLVSQLLVLGKEEKRWYDWLLMAVLLGGILYSGSRTVFVLTVAANLAMGITAKKKAARIITLAAVGVGILGIAVLAVVSDSDVLGRFLRLSLTESTFAGRFLYFWDAIPVILKHPFGLGHMGYYYIQQSVQTGVYATTFVHNDLLQLMLDLGWLPCILLLIAFFKAVKAASTPRKILLFTMLAHFCFDFDLQFGAVFLLLILLLDPCQGKTVSWKKPGWVSACAGVLAVVSLYMAVALFLPRVDQPEASAAMYPWHTQNNTFLLTQYADTEKGEALADAIIEQNKYVNLAYSIKARGAYHSGNFVELMRYKNEIFTRFPFQYPEYEEYCRMLMIGIQLYTQAGDTASADICRQELRKVKATVEALGDRLSPLGKIIVDQPTTTLPLDIQEYIAAMK